MIALAIRLPALPARQRRKRPVLGGNDFRRTHRQRRGCARPGSAAPRRCVRLPLFQKRTASAKPSPSANSPARWKKSCASSALSSAPARWKAARGKPSKPTFACSRANPPTASNFSFSRACATNCAPNSASRRAFCVFADCAAASNSSPARGAGAAVAKNYKTTSSNTFAAA